MLIQIDEEVLVHWEFSLQERAKQVIIASLELEKCPFEIEVNLLITDCDTICEINREQRGVDAPTDVLSFPMSEFRVPGDFSCLKGEAFDFNPDTKDWIAGDIVLCAEKIEEQAFQFGHSIEREYGFLIAHSMLHLFGYDHIQEEEQEQMEEKQKRIMERVGLGR